MLKKSELQNFESECTTVEGWIDLAEQALEELDDDNYAVELVYKAKKDCQNPEDYAKLAQFVAEHLLTDSHFVDEIFETGENTPIWNHWSTLNLVMPAPTSTNLNWGWL